MLKKGTVDHQIVCLVKICVLLRDIPHPCGCLHNQKTPHRAWRKAHSVIRKKIGERRDKQKDDDQMRVSGNQGIRKQEVREILAF